MHGRFLYLIEFIRIGTTTTQTFKTLLEKESQRKYGPIEVKSFIKTFSGFPKTKMQTYAINSGVKYAFVERFN